jgi:hypothetical protein
VKLKLNLQLHMCYFIRELEVKTRWKERRLRFMQIFVENDGSFCCLMPGSYAKIQFGA